MTYDTNGNTLSDGVNSYVWDARNRLVSANSSGATFAYDALGRRINKNILGANTNLHYDGSNPVQELNGSTVTANLLTGGVDEYFTRTDSSGTSNFLTDALGSTIALTDASGNSQVQYSYGPFGSISITGTTDNTFTYTGRETDGLGLYYYRARYYNPATGRFISEDPIGFQGGFNKYVYAADDPMDFNDPFGMDKNAPDNPIKSQECSALKAYASKLAGLLNNLSDTTGWTAFGTGVLAILSGVAEVPTAGLDTPGTITAGALTEFLGSVSVVTGGAAAAFNSYANGNASALWNFDASQLANLAAMAAASRIPILKPWASRIGDLAGQASNLTLKTKEGCQ